MQIYQVTIKNKSDYTMLSNSVYFLFVCTLCFYMCFILLIDTAYFYKLVFAMDYSKHWLIDANIMHL